MEVLFQLLTIDLSIDLTIELSMVVFCDRQSISIAVHIVFLPEPVYKGPEYVTFFRGPNLEQELERDKRITWLIEFYTPWAPTCVTFSTVFAELSAK